MPTNRSELNEASLKLVDAIDKEWREAYGPASESNTLEVALHRIGKISEDRQLWVFTARQATKEYRKLWKLLKKQGVWTGVFHRDFRSPRRWLILLLRRWRRYWCDRRGKCERKFCTRPAYRHGRCGHHWGWIVYNTCVILDGAPPEAEERRAS